MQKKFKCTVRILSIVLSILMLFELLPMQVLASAHTAGLSGTTPDTETSVTTDESALPAEDSDILLEVPEKRDEYTKVYLRGGSRYTAVVSSAPLHYLDDGEWVDIDNTLTETSVNGQAFFTNTANPFRVDFPERISEDTAIRIENGGYTISFYVNDIADSSISFVDTSPVEEPADSTAEIDAELTKNNSTVEYGNILNDTDIQYTVSSKSIKENIIVHTPSAVQSAYSFTVSAPGLQATLEENGSISFKSADGDDIFFIPAPVMTDDAGAVSSEIGVALSENSSELYTLTYTPSAAWLADTARVYPVAIDPMIHEGSQELITGTFVSSNEPSVNFSTQNHYIAQNNYTENHTNDMFHETYLNFNLDALFSLYPSATLTDVQLSLYGVGYNLAVHEITSAWNPSTVTYATRPSLSEHVVDYFAGEQDIASFHNLHFDITKPFAAWFNGERASYGLAITEFDPNAEAYGFMTKDANSSFTRPPALYIDFIEAAGYNNTFDYHTQDIARAGTAYINNFTRNLFLQRDDISISGNIMPVTISFLYNSGLIQQIEQYPLDDITPTPVYGNGWLTNYNRVLTPNAISGAISYAAADGTIVYFTIEDGEDGSNIITEENAGELGAKGYSIDISGIPEDCETLGLEYLKLLTPKGETESFDMFGRVIKIQKTARPSQSIDIYYTTNYTSVATTDFSDFLKIDYITDGVGRKYDFTYDATSGLLTSIQCYTADGTAIKAGSTEKDLKNTYTYTDGNLTKVTFPDSKTASYEYSINRMCTAISNDIYKVSYNYMPFYGTVSSNKKIVIVFEYARKSSTDDYTSGESLAILPDGPHQTKFFKPGDVSNFEIHQFDKFGRTTGIIDNQGNYSACSFSNKSFGNETYGQIASAANAMQLVNTGFENDLTGWDAEAFTNADIVSAETHSGTKALKISSEETVNKVISQSIPIAVDTGFTFSAYVKAAQTNTAHMLTMKVIAFNSVTNSHYENTRQIAAVHNEFERYSVQLQIPEFEEFTHIAVEIGLNGSAGTFYVDSMQLDSGLGARDYNYLTDGSLYDQTTNELSSSWTAVGAYTTVQNTTDGQLPAEQIFLSADCGLNSLRTLSQTVPIQADENDILTFGGWVKTDFVSNGSEHSLANEYNDFTGDRFAGLKIQYTYTTEENGEQITKTEIVSQPVNPYVTSWQYVAVCAAIKGTCTSVTVWFEAVKTPNETGVACLLLSKTEGVAYEEDLNSDIGEIPSGIICVCGESCAYGAGCTCTCTSEADCTCTQCKGCPCTDCTQYDCACTCESEEACTCTQCKKKYNITYDDFGNLLSMSISGYDLNSLLSMLMSRSFSENGNYLTSSTNENGGTTQYLYDQANGYLQSVTDARGNPTNYTYNSSGQLFTVDTPISGTSGTKAYYYYDNADRVDKIVHNDFAYNIEYDAWGNVTLLKSGYIIVPMHQTLATYTYGTAKKRNQLLEVQYYNSGGINYTYNDNDRVLQMVLKDSTGATSDVYTYYYDTEGNVLAITMQSNAYERVIYYNENSVEIYTSGCLEYHASLDDEGNLVELINGIARTSKTYDSTRIEETGKIVSKSVVTADNGVTLGMSQLTDSFGRTEQKTVLSKDPTNTSTENSFAAVLTNYAYKTFTKDGNTVASGQVGTIENKVSYGTTMAAENVKSTQKLAYTYDSNDNIIYEYAVAENGTQTVRYHYVYDEANQLIRCDDAIQQKTFVYTYNKGGNRTETKIYTYGLGHIEGLTLLETIESKYTTLWARDRLEKYNGIDITYDGAGNPTAYNGKTYHWSGKQLKQVTAADGSYTQYNYDMDGLRAQKRQYKADSSLEYLVDYVWSDGKIVAQSLSLPMVINNISSYLTIDVKYVYEAGASAPCGVMADEGEYLFVRNLQGDVLAVVDGANGETIANYSYDAWGKLSMQITPEYDNVLMDLLIKVICPLTYRGYNYDFTTELYYLQSRYYCPEWGRFLNVDDTSILLASVGNAQGFNLYAYCNNNPVNRVDYTGTDSTIGMICANLFYVLIPLVLSVQRITYLGYGYIFDYVSSIIFNFGVDPKSGIMMYSVIINTMNNSVNVDMYSYKYYWGDYYQWDRYADNIQNSSLLSFLANPIASILMGAVPVTINPYVSLLATASFAYVQHASSSQKKFAATTKSALDTAASLRSKNDLLFEYLDAIYHDTYYMGQHFGSIIYRGDEHINVIQ